MRKSQFLANNAAAFELLGTLWQFEFGSSL